MLNKKDLESKGNVKDFNQTDDAKQPRIKKASRRDK